MKDFSAYTDYLFSQVPMFQNIGKDAYKEGLENTRILDEHFHHPHSSFHTIHIAGTNGKGSCSHTIASILQEAGYRVGLFTSPHLVDFRERIRVNGEKISEEYVMNFIDQERDFFEPLHPTFFELTTALAFKYFAEQRVEVAVIEVGLGGRLDCTNIIQPDLSIITNISFDHTQFLGNTLAKIAGEKAGIIKHGVPVVIGEYTDETRPVFETHALRQKTNIIFAEDIHIDTYPDFELKGEYQRKNLQTILCAISTLQSTTDIKRHKFYSRISEKAIEKGLLNVCRNTNLMGRWQTMQEKPKVICDIGHNVGGITYVAQQLKKQKYQQLRIVFGMVSDKDVNSVLDIMPKDASYYFCQASVKRAMNHEELGRIASTHHLKGKTFPTVGQAYQSALQESGQKDLIFIGGSNFVVADFLSFKEKCK